jgi:hypothetical protein
MSYTYAHGYEQIDREKRHAALLNALRRLASAAGPGPPGGEGGEGLSALSVSTANHVLHGAFVWERRVCNGPKRRFPRPAVEEHGLDLPRFHSVNVRVGFGAQGWRWRTAQLARPVRGRHCCLQ